MRIKPSFLSGEEVAALARSGDWKTNEQSEYIFPSFQRHTQEGVEGFLITQDDEPICYVVHDVFTRKGFMRLTTHPVNLSGFDYWKKLMQFKHEFHDLHVNKAKENGLKGMMQMELFDSTHDDLVQRVNEFEPAKDMGALSDEEAVFASYFVRSTHGQLEHVFKDEQGHLWITKKPQKQRDGNEYMHKDRNNAGRERMVWEMGKGLVNLCEVKTHRAFGNKGYGVKLLQHQDLPYDNLRSALSAMVVFDLYTHRFDPNPGNILYRGHTAAHIDYDQAFSASMPWYLLVVLYARDLVSTPFVDDLKETLLNPDFYDWEVMKEVHDALVGKKVFPTVNANVPLQRENKPMKDFIRENKKHLWKKVNYLVEFLTHERFRNGPLPSWRDIAKIDCDQNAFCCRVRPRTSFNALRI